MLRREKTVPNMSFASSSLDRALRVLVTVSGSTGRPAADCGLVVLECEEMGRGVHFLL